jgi:L,D-peptidoglycan transpeptidase YkuD (ErfK/YbiS/YcfS/YnhG family)
MPEPVRRVGFVRFPAPLLLACLLAACASGGTTTSAAPSSTEPTVDAPATTTSPRLEPQPTTTTAPAVPQLAEVGPAEQAIVVHAPAYGSTTATLTAYQRGPSGWDVAFGPWQARVGTSGMAPPGEKREGDGRTPSGVYGFDFMFGVDPDPGVRFPYRRVTPSIVWSDDPASPQYNLWIDRDSEDPGREPESMYQPVAYRHGAVIAYNTARTPGLGSAIFLHASTGGPTAGCVSLPVDQLVQVLRWLDPAKAPRIVLSAS